MSGAAAPEAGANEPLFGYPKSTGDTAWNDLARALRRVTSLTVGRPLNDSDLAEAAQAVDAVADRLEEAALPGKRPRTQPDITEPPQDYFPTSPIVGYANPIAPPVDLWAVEGEEGRLELRGRANFGYPYEGPPTCVHGGVIAMLFDEMLGSANIIAERGAMTGTLTIRYRRPTPLLTPIDLEARLVRIEGRKVFAWGGLSVDGELTAEAEGIFIVPNPERMAQVVTTNAKRAEGDVVDSQLDQFVQAGKRIMGVEGTRLTERPAEG
jgi:acyl-coenzyme A thioesterase PaaI-like protein